MVKDESKIWEKFYGKKICSERLNIEGFGKPIPFDIYDGHAVWTTRGIGWTWCTHKSRLLRIARSYLMPL